MRESLARLYHFGAMAEEIIWDELLRNNIDIDKDTLYFHMNECPRKHSELYGNVRIGVDNFTEKLCDIYREACCQFRTNYCLFGFRFEI